MGKNHLNVVVSAKVSFRPVDEFHIARTKPCILHYRRRTEESVQSRHDIRDLVFGSWARVFSSVSAGTSELVMELRGHMLLKCVWSKLFDLLLISRC